MKDFFKLKKIDLDLQKIINPVSFFDVNPLNLLSEKEKVLKDPDYNPQFAYPAIDFDLDAVEAQLHSVDEHDSALGNLLNKKRNIFIDKCEMLRNRGTSKFTIFSKKVYGLPSKDVLERAANFLVLESEKEPKTVPSSKVADILQAEINHYGFDYAVSTKTMSASAMVLVSKKKIFVRDDFIFSENFN